jgi:hypothetical protein
MGHVSTPVGRCSRAVRDDCGRTNSDTVIAEGGLVSVSGPGPAHRPDGPARPHQDDQRKPLNNPWLITIIGGAIATVIAAVILARVLGIGAPSSTPQPSPPAGSGRTSTASASNPTSSTRPRATANPSLQPEPSAELRKLLVTASDLPSGWTATDPYGWPDLAIGGFNTCQGTGSNQSVAPLAAGGEFASVLTAFNAPQGGSDFILQNLASFVSVDAAKGYLDQLRQQIASCPSYQGPQLRTASSVGAHSLAFIEGSAAYESYVVATRVGDVVCTVSNGSYFSPTQQALAQYLAKTTISRFSNVR